MHIGPIIKHSELSVVTQIKIARYSPSRTACTRVEVVSGGYPLDERKRRRFLGVVAAEACVRINWQAGRVDQPGSNRYVQDFSLACVSRSDAGIEPR